MDSDVVWDCKLGS